MLFSSSCSKDGDVGHLKEGIQEFKVREFCNIRKHAWSRGLLNWWNWITSLLLQKVIWNLMWMEVGTARGNLGLAGISGVLRNDKWEVTFMFSNNVGVKDSNEEMWATLEALLHSCSLLNRQIVECDSSNATCGMISKENHKQKFYFHFQDNKMSSSVQVNFQYVGRLANSSGKAKGRIGL